MLHLEMTITIKMRGLEVFFNVKSALKLVNKFKSNHT